MLLQAVEKDDDKEAVSVAVTAASEIVRGCGAKACAAHLPALIDAVGKVPALCAASRVPYSAGQRYFWQQQLMLTKCLHCAGPVLL